MSDSVERVVCEGQGDPELEPYFYKHWQTSKSRGHCHRFDVKPEERRNEVRKPEDVEPSREDAASNAIQDRTIPRDLWSIYG